MRSEFTVHHVDGVDSLVCGESDAAAEEVKKHVAMTSENWSEDVGLLLVGSEALELFTAAAAAVIEEDGGEGSLVWRMAKQGTQSQSPAPHFDSLRHVVRAALMESIAGDPQSRKSAI